MGVLRLSASLLKAWSRVMGSSLLFFHWIKKGSLREGCRALMMPMGSSMAAMPALVLGLRNSNLILGSSQAQSLREVAPAPTQISTSFGI